MKKVAKTLNIPEQEKKFIEQSKNEMLVAQREVQTQLDKKNEKEIKQRENYKKQFTQNKVEKMRTMIKDMIFGYAKDNLADGQTNHYTAEILDDMGRIVSDD